MLLAASLAGMTTSLRAQSAEDDAGTVTTDTGRRHSLRARTKSKNQPGEPKGTNVTGAEKTTEATVDPSDADKKDTKSSAGEEKTSSTESQK